MRIDDPDSFSPGFNFRYLDKYYMKNGDGEEVLTRDITKIWGMRVVFLVSGEGRKFDSPIPFFVAFGSGLGLVFLFCFLFFYFIFIF